MNAYEAATPSEMLMAFLEGDLEGTHEDILFSYLSDDHTLRTEMRELIAVNRLARLDAGLMTPPSAWKREVMKGIAGTGRAIEERRGNRPVPAGWYRHGVIALAALLIGVLGTLATLRLTNDAGMTDASSRPASASNDVEQGGPSPTIVSESETDGPHPPIAPHDVSRKSPGNRWMESLSVQSRRTTEDLNGGDNRMGTNDDGNDPADDATESNLRGEELNPAVASIQTLVDVDEDATASGSVDDAHAISSSLAHPSAPDLKVRRERIEVGYRHSLGSNHPNVALPSTASEGFGEMGLSLLYRLDDHHRVGLEGGRGNFPQIFRRVENGELVRYEQNPTLLWYGLAYEYSSDPIFFDALRPFARLIAGGTAAGPVTRGILGVRFIPESRVALTVGAEGSLMLYEFQNDWFTSSGLDFTYGVSFTF